jgi:hypothetical protein
MTVIIEGDVRPTVPRTLTMLRGAARPLLIAIIANAVLQSLLTLPSPSGMDLVAILCAVGSLVVLIAAVRLAARALARTLTSTPRQGTAWQRARNTVRTYPWRFVRVLIGSMALGALGWLVGLLVVVFLPGLLAIIVAWILIGMLACPIIAWWSRLAHMPTPADAVRESVLR